MKRRNQALTNSRVDQFLRSIDRQASGSLQQLEQFKAVVEMDRKFRSVETTFAGVYAKASSLTKSILATKEKWHSKKS